MKNSNRVTDSGFKSHNKWLYFPALLALILLAYGAYFVENQNANLNMQEERGRVLQAINHMGNQFENQMNSTISLARGLAAAYSVEPNMNQTQFSNLSNQLFPKLEQITRITAAPDFRVYMVYPFQGNQSIIGEKYVEHSGNADGIDDSIKSDLLDGNISLVQNKNQIVAHIPVFVKSGVQEPKFWGLVSAFMDADFVYAQAGLLESNDLQLSLELDNGNGSAHQIFSTQDESDFSNPISVQFSIADANYTLSAVPAAGWSDGLPNLWRNRFLSILADLLVVFPIVVAGWLVGERQKNIRRLQDSAKDLTRVSNRLELALSTSQIGVWEFDSSNEELIWDERMCEIYDVPNGENPNYQNWVERLHPDDLEQAKHEFSLALVEQKVYHSQFRVIKRDGTINVIRTIGSTSLDEHGFVKITGINWDITDEVLKNEQLETAKNLSEARNKELEETKIRIEHNSLHDSLTGLPNRRYLDEVLTGQHENRYGMVKNYSLLHVDLDRFKQINDTLGHAAGDKMLIHAAEVLSRNVRSSDFVARVGGDEFVVLCTSRMDKQILHKLAARINDEMSRPLIIDQRESRCGVSIGIASYDSVQGTPEQLLINADIALYQAKNRGRNTYRFYTKKMHEAAVSTKCVADEILTGIDENQFIVHYQGQFDAQTLEISGVEALARWKHPTKGLLGPDSFITIAEELNVMAQIDAQVLNQSLDQMKAWKLAGVNVPQVSVNISARRLGDERLIEGLKELNIKPGTLTFEFLETILLEETSDQVTWNIDQIRELGIDIELDDFGTGYASIVSLMQLRPKMFKIDRQLVMPITESFAQRELVQSIVNIGSALGIGAVAEGVESMEHAKIMSELGCKTLQGFGLARPMDGDAFADFVHKMKKNPLLVA